MTRARVVGDNKGSAVEERCKMVDILFYMDSQCRTPEFARHFVYNFAITGAPT
jgi:hypothetical protein